MTQPINLSAASPESKIKKKFVAINYISCQEAYKPRFEELFASRAHAIDRIPGSCLPAGPMLSIGFPVLLKWKS